MNAKPVVASATTTFTAWLIVTALAIGLTPVAQANAAEVAGSFSQGRSRLSIVGGSGYAFNETYVVLGVGASYYLVDGLNAGLDVEWWSGGDPAIVKASPSVQYVFTKCRRWLRISERFIAGVTGESPGARVCWRPRRCVFYRWPEHLFRRGNGLRILLRL
jgi:hypothetical protein